MLVAYSQPSQASSLKNGIAIKAQLSLASAGDPVPAGEIKRPLELYTAPLGSGGVLAAPMQTANKVRTHNAKIDSDVDGVLDYRDQCLESNRLLTVDKSGCALLEGYVRELQFYPGTYSLTLTAKEFLDSVSTQLVRYDTRKIILVAHTDGSGSKQRNQILSEERARSIINYLVSNGVPRRIFITRAQGEKNRLLRTALNEENR